MNPDDESLRPGVGADTGEVPASFDHLVRQGGQALAAADIDEGWREAGLLLAQVLGRDRAWLIAHGDEVAGADQARAFQSLIARRLAGEPMAYVLGQHGFWSLSLKVTPAVLVPRPETELLVEQVLACLPQTRPARPVRIADLGTGSGAIALALASERPQWQIVATDASAAALAVAEDNARVLGLEQRVHFRQGHWYQALAGQPAFDALVSNPPYIVRDDDHLAAPALRHEPQSALVSGSDGLDDIRQIIAGAAEHLRPGGWLLLEHGWDQAKAVRALLHAHGFAGIDSRRDLGGQPRISFGRRPG
ncbi:MAG: peptide chain release factor N(5)-glutamine methyltransferase [Xanthomonadales bacterium]|nr:peptide chain release factor N(5)-glutamine methyltransferase [Xanthomonadales bacterium]